MQPADSSSGAASRGDTWRYVPALDGLRCLAVYLVLLFHTGLAAAHGGFIGVDLFFVLSGFLITNVLLSDIGGSGRIHFGAFYARRARRLLLPAVLVIVVTSIVFLLISSVVDRIPLVGDAQSSLLYVANWHFLAESNNYFATGVAKSPFLHFWSLGIEEQFYVVFPLLLLVLVWVGRRRLWLAAAIVTVLLALSLTAEVHWSHIDPNHAYYGTDTRAYQLLAGVLLALLWRNRPMRLTSRGVRVADAVALVGLVAAIVLGTGLVSIDVSMRGIAAVGAGVLAIGGVTMAERGRAASMLSRPTPVYLGKISYATYLWHWPIIVAITTLYHVAPLPLAAITAVAATGLAALSSVILENPIRRSRLLDRVRWPTVAAGVSLCAIVAVAFVPSVLNSTRRPVVTTATSVPSHKLSAAAAAAPVVHRASFRSLSKAKIPNLPWNYYINHNGPERSCTAAVPQQCVVVPGGRPVVVLVGDSHARMIEPVLAALAREHGFTLAENAMSGCPWQAQLTNLVLDPQAQAKCTAERQAWYSNVLPKLHPDLVIAASYARDDTAIYGHSLLRTGGSSETLHQLIKDTTNETVGQITATGARALILRGIYTSVFDPLSCLSAATYVHQCLVPATHQTVSDLYYRDAAAADPQNVFTFGINKAACPTAPVCLPIRDGIPVWRNVNHYTPQILIHVRAQVWKAIEASGALKGLTWGGPHLPGASPR
jgi:peptidoglycan/LPS O-acetylase OafA/YrhL